jgi:hypothetical protein
MSSAGMNPFAYYDPQDYAAQLAIQRQQALGQQLMQQPMGTGGYAGLAEAGNRLLGAFLSRRADQKLADYYNQPDAQTGQQAARTPPQASPPTYSNANVDEEGNPIPQHQFAPPPAPSVQQPQQMDEKPSDYYSLPPRFQRLYDRLPHIPGMLAAQAVGYFTTNPTGYQAEWAKQFEATPEQKNAAFAMPGDVGSQRTTVGGILNKAGTITGRAGNVLIGPDGKTTYVPPQAPPGYRYIQGQDGQPYLVQIAGGPAGVAGSAAAQGYGKASVTPAIGYDANNQPVATNQAAMLGSPQIPGVTLPQPGAGQPQYAVPGGPNINANNPLNMQPGGQEARYATPTAGFGTAWDNLTNYANKGINTVSGIVRAWAGPNAPPEYAASVAKSLGVDPNQPLNLRDPNVKGLLIDAMRPNETGNRYGSQIQSTPMLPELPAGQASYMQGQAKDAADRHDATVQAASESPMRINVLDNIIGLSGSGVATGPGQEWQNSVLGYASNLPGLSPFMAKAKDNVAKFQELQKFTYQNAIRSWQAAGGTGTDAQMESMAHANPNDKLFPAALQQIAKWGKAAELAVQGKANAQDQFLAQNGQTPANQIKFESLWRNNFDPKVFQYSLMSPQEKLNFAHTQLKTPQAAKAFLAKQQALKAMGAIQ